VSRGPHLGQKGNFNATKNGSRGPDVARRPYVAPFCPRGLKEKKTNFMMITFSGLKMSTESNVARQEREKLKLEIQREKEKLLKVFH
jgi:hypothetical protein